ncbi:TonB-dependent receptor [Altererythrobacter sp. B11]|uniref:TonB-dependent receptor n=1 Tax=Altererythrobacter sp. B11 TaxID=2060312 RepID=UPI000DC712B8|nr:TonB-dependent receptor [Altererythrobacter sp. B11]BBC72804.1 TonB-dependent receptor [Altererythrobacter sp. B11]
MRFVTGSIVAALFATASTQALAAQEQDTQPGDSAAASAAEEGNAIIVTAQRREQSLQDVSAAITAIGSDRLTEGQVNSLQDLQTVVPSVNFGSDFNQAKIFIRGVGANTSTTGNATGVALHVDGAVVSRAEAQLTSLFDLERVEVLRGPQGTLYGRNATGGSINLITAKPTRDLSGYARLTYGNYNSLISEAAISGPITDTILFRIATKTEDRDGYGENPVTGSEVDDLKRRMIRGHLQFDITPSTELLLTGEYFRQDDNSGAIHYLRASFPGVPRLAPLGVGGYAVKPRDLASEIDGGTDTETYAFTGTFRTDLTDSLTLTNIANFRSFKSSLFQDLDLSAVVDSLQTNGQPTTVQERRIDSKQWSNELQLNYSTDFIDVVLGGFYFHERQRPIDNVGLSRKNGMASNIPLLQAAGVDLDEAYALCGYQPDGVTGGSSVIAPKRVCTRSNLGTDAYAIFGQANIGLGLFSEALDTLTVKLGGRYSHEKIESANPSIIIAGGGRGPVIRYTTEGTYRERSFSDFTPELGLEWQPNPDIMVYYTYSEGFKAGSGENAAGSTTIVDPETIQNHEAGIKATVMSGLSVNLAAYTYDLEGLQLNKTIAGGPTGYQTIFQNAAATTAKGIELDIFGRITPNFRMSGSLSYTDAEFKNYATLDPLNPANILTAGSPAYDPVTNPDPTAYGAPSGGEIQLAGNQLRNSPKWAWNVHGEYDVDLPNGVITFLGDVSYKSRTYFTEFEREIESSAPYAMVDASIRYQTLEDRLSVQLWAKNLFDTDRASSTFALATGRLLGVTYLAPRTYGVTVGYDF